MPKFRFQCKFCQYSTNESSHLKAHSVVHDPKRNYVCEVCGNRFKTLASLASHKLIHTGG